MSSDIPLRYGNAPGYDRYMGHWSAILAPPFLAFANLASPTNLLDVGCGTGNLLVAASALFPHANLIGVDPSHALLQRSLSRPELLETILIEATAETLPFADESFDACLSLLVLQEFTDITGTLNEMRRVTRSNGIVAACKWDYSRMPIVASLTAAIASVNPLESERLSSNSPDLFCNEAALAWAWADVGLEQVDTSRIQAIHRYSSFDELWTSVRSGTTESTMMLMDLPACEQEVVRRKMEVSLAPGSRTNELAIRAEALVVRGIANKL